MAPLQIWDRSGTVSGFPCAGLGINYLLLIQKLCPPLALGSLMPPGETNSLHVQKSPPAWGILVDHSLIAEMLSDPITITVSMPGF